MTNQWKKVLKARSGRDPQECRGRDCKEAVAALESCHYKHSRFTKCKEYDSWQMGSSATRLEMVNRLIKFDLTAFPIELVEVLKLTRRLTL